MSMAARAGVSGLVASVAVAGLLALAPSAMSSFHLMKVREVDPSTDAASNDGFIELQMWQPGQNFTAGHQVTVYDGAGAVVDTATLPNVPNGANQARSLIGETGTVGTTAADVVDTGLNIPPAAGAVCFAAAPDCVTWASSRLRRGSRISNRPMRAAPPRANRSPARSWAAAPRSWRIPRTTATTAAPISPRWRRPHRQTQTPSRRPTAC